MSKGSPAMADLSALSSLAPELAATFVTIASDIALVIDPSGVIRNVAVGEADLASSTDGWIGRPWADTVTSDTRLKIEQLLQEVGSGRASRRREVTHPGGTGAGIPMAWAAIRLGQGGPVLAVGRDLRAVAAIQQRFIDAQQEIERDYWQRRQAESRYRLLFQVATDAVLVVDAQTLRILEANRAAMHLFARPLEELVGRAVTVGIDPSSRPIVDELLTMARSTGRAAEVRARVLPPQPAPGQRPALIDVSATPFRSVDAGQGGTPGGQWLLLVRARAVQPGEADAGESRHLAEYVERSADAIAITDSAGRLLMFNPAFVQIASPGRDSRLLKGCELTQVLGDDGGAVSALLDEVRRQGIVAQAELSVRPAGLPAGLTALALEASAAMLAEGDQECIGLTLRRAPALAQAPVATGLASNLAQALAALGQELDAGFGQRSLAQMVQAAADLAEQRLIDAALRRSDGDVRAAAALLGITPELLAARQGGPADPPVPT